MKRLRLIALIVFLYSIPTYAIPSSFTETEAVKYDESTMHTYHHKKNGLEVTWIQNKDIKKSFILGVKTPTTDSTGVNHIIEHTVFTGSKKFPSATLFFDANQRYPNIFMNAMTSGDLTMYPFCTPYEVCYNNLLNIYLDSIFNPNLLNQSNSFYEEAFHYNPTTKKYGGVVYNEMKGANTSLERLLFRTSRAVIYQGTHYENDSGGDPLEIPKLTYNQFVQTYQNYYYPQNMKVIVYGDLDIDYTLETIDQYIKDYPSDKKEIDLGVTLKPIEKNYTRDYWNPKNQTYIIKSFVVDHPLSVEEKLDLDIWVNLYLMDSQSYFQKELERQGLRRVKVYKDDDLPYPVYNLILENAQSQNKEQSIQIIEKVLQEIATKKWCNPKREEAVLTQIKLEMAQLGESNTRGLDIGQSMLDAWAHNGEPDQYFEGINYVESLQQVNHNISDVLLLSPMQTTITLVPTQTKEEVEPSSLSSLTTEEWSKVVTQLEQWQQKQTPIEFPKVEIENLTLQPKVPLKLTEEQEGKFMCTPIKGKLAQTDLYYNTNHITQEELPYLFLYNYFLSEAGREEDLKVWIQTKAFACDQGTDYTPYFRTSILSLAQDKNHVDSLIQARMALLSKKKEWYYKKLAKYLIDFKQAFSGDVLGTLSVLNMGSGTEAKRYEYESTYPLYNLCKKLYQSKDDHWIKNIQKLDGKLYKQEGVYVGIMAPKEYLKDYKKQWKHYLKDQRVEGATLQTYHFKPTTKKSYYLIGGEVDYVVAEYKGQEEKVDGVDYVLASFLSKNYLTPTIRLKKGAYGAGARANYPNSFTCYTYRDPDYRTSLEIFNQMCDEALQNLSAETLEAAKAEALSAFHRQFKLLENDRVLTSAYHLYALMHVDNQTIQTLENEIIHTQLEDLQKKLEILKEKMATGKLAIATQKDKLPEGMPFKVYSF